MAFTNCLVHNLTCCFGQHVLMSHWITNLRISFSIHGQKITKCATCFFFFFFFTCNIVKECGSRINNLFLQVWNHTWGTLKVKILPYMHQTKYCFKGIKWTNFFFLTLSLLFFLMHVFKPSYIYLYIYIFIYLDIKFWYPKFIYIFSTWSCQD